MELDIPTLRVAFAALSAFPLLYFATYRSSRSAYSAWWCVALVLFNAGSAAYGWDDIVWAPATGHAMVVMGAVCTWAATRALRDRRTPIRVLVPFGAIVWSVAMLDASAGGIDVDDALFLVLTSAMFAMASVELGRPGTDILPFQRPMAAVGCVVSVYFLSRAGRLAAGESNQTDAGVLPPEMMTVVKLLLLVTAVFCMLVLGHEQSTRDLRRRATRDGLTGLLNRTEFLRQASEASHARYGAGPSDALIMADLDHFKLVNDTHGHHAGDQALRTFAAACRSSVRSTDLVGRFGGEEFVLLLHDTSLHRAEEVAREISAVLRTAQVPEASHLPTVSYGVAALDPALGVEATIARADAALYRAKMLGRDRVVCDQTVRPEPAQPDHASAPDPS